MAFCKNKLIVILCGILFLISIISSVVKVIGIKSSELSLGVLNADKIEFYSDKKGNAIILQCDDDHTLIQNQSKSEEVVLDSKYDFSKKCDNFIYLFKSEEDLSGDEFLRTLSVVVYSITKNEIVARNSFNIASCNQNDFAVLKNGCFFVVSSNFRKNIFLCRCANGKLSAHVLKEDVKCINSNENGSLIHVCLSDGTTAVFDNKLKKIADVTIDAETFIEFLNEDTVVDMLGQVYLSKTKGSYDFTPFVKLNRATDKVCVIGEYIVYADLEDKINLVNITSAEMLSGFKINGEIKYLASCNDGLVIVFERDDETFFKKISIDDVLNELSKTEDEMQIAENVSYTAKYAENDKMQKFCDENILDRLDEKHGDESKDEKIIANETDNAKTEDFKETEKKEKCGGFEGKSVDEILNAKKDQTSDTTDGSVTEDVKLAKNEIEAEELNQDSKESDENAIENKEDETTTTASTENGECTEEREIMTGGTVESNNIISESARLIAQNTIACLKKCDVNCDFEKSTSLADIQSTDQISDFKENLAQKNSSEIRISENATGITDYIENSEFTTDSINGSDTIKSESARLIAQNTIARFKKRALSCQQKESENVKNVKEFDPMSDLIKSLDKPDFSVKSLKCVKDQETVVTGDDSARLCNMPSLESIASKLCAAGVTKKKNQLKVRGLSQGKQGGRSTRSKIIAEKTDANNLKEHSKKTRSKITKMETRKLTEKSTKRCSKFASCVRKEVKVREKPRKEVTLAQTVNDNSKKTNFSIARKARQTRKSRQKTRCVSAVSRITKSRATAKNLRKSASLSKTKNSKAKAVSLDKRKTASLVSDKPVVAQSSNLSKTKNSKAKAVGLDKRKTASLVSDKPIVARSESSSINFDLVSDLYKFDCSKKLVTGIDIGTKISDFKKNLKLPGCDVSFSKNDKLVKNGRIGTNTMITLSAAKGHGTAFKAVVLGDLTGTGKISKKDMNEMYRHIFGEKILNDVFFDAADLNGDGVVDTLDLLLLSKLVSA